MPNRFTSQVNDVALWPILAILAIASVWVLPNHYLPWAAFHSDALMAGTLLLGGWCILLMTSKTPSIPGIATLALGLSVLPWAQYGIGQIPTFGQAWISSLYLLGFSLAITLGALFHREKQFQFVEILLSAVVVAAIVSLYLQLRAWLDIEKVGFFEIWAISPGRERPYGNLAQPNQLATLLLWAVLGALWAYQKKVVSGTVATMLGAFLLMGVSLTQSRTAVLGSTLLLVLLFAWKKHWRSHLVPLVGAGLFLLFFTYPHLFKQLDELLFPNIPLSLHQRDLIPGQGDARLAAWKMFGIAATESPWLGYGWTDLQRIHLNFVDISPHLGSAFAHSHNLFLDLVLWVGIPVGLGIAGFICFWFFRKVKTANSPEASILIAALGVVGIHAMLELPLHYAYFLLPVGIMIGTLDALEFETRSVSIPKKTLASLMAAATVGLALTIADYVEIERDFYNARFTLANIGQPINNESPRTLVLTQLRKRIDLFDVNPRTTMSDAQLDEMVQSATRNPGAAPMYRLATALAYNNRPDEARHWLDAACKIVSQEDCADMGEVWTRDRQTDSRIATVVWPIR